MKSIIIDSDGSFTKLRTIAADDTTHYPMLFPAAGWTRIRICMRVTQFHRDSRFDLAEGKRCSLRGRRLFRAKNRTIRVKFSRVSYFSNYPSKTEPVDVKSLQRKRSSVYVNFTIHRNFNKNQHSNFQSFLKCRSFIENIIRPREKYLYFIPFLSPGPIERLCSFASVINDSASRLWAEIFERCVVSETNNLQ